MASFSEASLGWKAPLPLFDLRVLAVEALAIEVLFSSSSRLRCLPPPR
jgi:hypothetical protein